MMIKENSSLVKSYAKIVSSSPSPSCEQLRQIIKDKEAVRTRNKQEQDTAYLNLARRVRSIILHKFLRT